jgi:hypothetical protein
MGEPVGTEKLAKLGLDKLAAVARAIEPRAEFAGLDVPAFAAAARAYLVDRSPGAPYPRVRLAIPT